MHLKDGRITCGYETHEVVEKEGRRNEQGTEGESEMNSAAAESFANVLSAMSWTLNKDEQTKRAFAAGVIPQDCNAQMKSAIEVDTQHFMEHEVGWSSHVFWREVDTHHFMEHEVGWVSCISSTLRPSYIQHDYVMP